MPKLVSLKPRVTSLQPPRQAWAKGALAPQRLSGRALVERNDRIKARDGYTCARCGRIAPDHDVDHIMPLSDGGSDCDANLQLLCHGRGLCHELKTLEDRRRK
jgi:5-methylcytosine-specific restriction endonuclease McrA